MSARSDRPAFPTPDGALGAGPWSGLTVREYAATAALQGLLAANIEQSEMTTRASLATHAVGLADALLAALEEPKS